MREGGAVTRRGALKLGAATATVIGGLHLVAAPAAAEEGKNGQSGQRRASSGASSFTAEIEGLPETSKSIREIHIDELTIDALETTTGQDLAYRQYRPGHPRYGVAKFTSAATLGASKELQAWFNDAATGKQIRPRRAVVRQITANGVVARTFTLENCLPTTFASIDLGSQGGAETMKWVVEVRVQRVEMK
jgi:hypothetical protein